MIIRIRKILINTKGASLDEIFNQRKYNGNQNNHEFAMPWRWCSDIKTFLRMYVADKIITIFFDFNLIEYTNSNPYWLILTQLGYVIFPQGNYNLHLWLLKWITVFGLWFFTNKQVLYPCINVTWSLPYDNMFKFLLCYCSPGAHIWALYIKSCWMYIKVPHPQWIKWHLS